MVVSSTQHCLFFACFFYVVLFHLNFISFIIIAIHYSQPLICSWIEYLMTFSFLLACLFCFVCVYGIHLSQQFPLLSYYPCPPPDISLFPDPLHFPSEKSSPAGLPGIFTENGIIKYNKTPLLVTPQTDHITSNRTRIYS